MFKRSRTGTGSVTPARQLSDELGLLDRIHTQGGEICFGGPTRCPECGAIGIVDRIADAVQFNGCLRCGDEWSFSAKAVSLYGDAKRPGQPEVVGSGVLVAELESDGWAHVTRERFVGMSDALESGSGSFNSCPLSER